MKDQVGPCRGTGC